MLAIGMIYFNECHLLMHLVIVDPYLILKSLSDVKCNKSATVVKIFKRRVKQRVFYWSSSMIFSQLSWCHGFLFDSYCFEGSGRVTTFFTVVGICLEQFLWSPSISMKCASIIFHCIIWGLQLIVILKILRKVMR